ncbi:MAG TPA: hypothetical protein VGE63_03205 [Candidatus Paceibacterota bacterium]
MKKELIIIVGANGEIGTEYINSLKTNLNIEILAVTLSKPYHDPSINNIRVDVRDYEAIEQALAHINLQDYLRVIYLHSIGTDVFEWTNYPQKLYRKTIPESVYDSNVNTFKYLLRYLSEKLKRTNTELKVVQIAGVADKYGFMVIESFHECKKITRAYARDLCDLYPNISGLTINITSCITKSALEVRPFADTSKGWLTPQEVVSESISSILSSECGYQEINILKPLPSFNPQEYYENQDRIYEKWAKEIGIKKAM